MSILDGLPTSKEEAEKAVTVCSELINALTSDSSVDPEIKELFKRLKSGSTIANLKGITQDELDALFNVGFELAVSGQFYKATSVMSQLCIIDPIAARNYYVLAGVHQMQGNYDIAGKLYVQCIALDATNPNSYIRLGECFLSAKEHTNARAAFEMARAFAEDGHGDKDSLALAEKMITIIEQHEGASDAEAKEPIH